MAARGRLLCLFVLPLSVVGVSCADDATTLVQYDDQRPVEKVNCSGGAKCAECCNDGACAEGQACNAGSMADDKVILFCDGPEDCGGDGKVCCVKRSSGGALVGACTTVCNDGGTKACHIPNDCDGQQCVTFEQAPFIGICDDPEGE